MKSPNIGIIGVGWVGIQLKRYFEEIRGYKAGKNLFLHDIDPMKCAGDINQADVIFITVPTPRNPKDDSCDLSIVADVIKNLRENLPSREVTERQGKIIVLKSTIPPGTTEIFQKEYPRHKFLFNPEFLKERTAWQDMLRPDRQIIGFTEKSLDVAGLILSLLPKAPFMSPHQQNQITATEAEFIKYAGNVYLVRKVNWANALANAAEKLGANYENIRKGMAADPRIGDSHLNVVHGGYRGWGGYCFPKDLDAFIQFSKKEGLKEVVDILVADRNFNEALLKKQGLTLGEVSIHIDKIAEKLSYKKTAPRY